MVFYLQDSNSKEKLTHMENPLEPQATARASFSKGAKTK